MRLENERGITLLNGENNTYVFGYSKELITMEAKALKKVEIKNVVAYRLPKFFVNIIRFILNRAGKLVYDGRNIKTGATIKGN